MDETKPKYLTVVFEIHNTEQAKKILDSTIINKVRSGDKKDDYSVVVATTKTEISQIAIDLVNEHHKKHRFEVANND